MLSDKRPSMVLALPRNNSGRLVNQHRYNQPVILPTEKNSYTAFCAKLAALPDHQPLEINCKQLKTSEIRQILDQLTRWGFSPHWLPAMRMIHVYPSKRSDHATR